MAQEDNLLVFRFPTGNVTLRYYLKPLLTEEGKTSSEEETAISKSPESTSIVKNDATMSKDTNLERTYEKEDNKHLWYILLGFAIIIPAALILSYKMIKVGKLAELSEEEADILQFLRKVGGKAYQSDIMKALGLPKTSTWRYVKRLEEKNLVKIEKIGGKNLVILK